jgi:hypothetical protein
MLTTLARRAPLALVIGLAVALVGAGPAHASGEVSPAGSQSATVTSGMVRSASAATPAVAWKSFTWNDLHSGDCTMFGGATWTLYSDGTATFDGTVTSSSDSDAWLMWLHVADANNAELGLLSNTNWFSDDRVKFVKGLPDHSWQYRWFTSGRYDANWFGLAQHMTMDHHC